VAGIIKRSSNVGSIQVAQLTGAERLHDALVRYRFGQRTGIELAGERSGGIRPAARWGTTDLAVISYGYGMTATPLQAVAGVAAIANRGLYTPPRLIRAVRDAVGNDVYTREIKPARIMSEKVAGQMVAMMASVFDRGRHGGTARSVDLGGFSAGGKTGTARKIDPATGAYGKLYLSSFVGVAPLGAPRIAVLVAVDEPTSGHYYGSTVAGGAFARIVDETLRYLGVQADREPDGEEAEPDAASDEVAPAESVEPAPAPRAATAGEIDVPDFHGLGIAAALRAARDAGVAVELHGTGRVARQSIEPGPARRGAVCRLTLSQRSPVTSPPATP
jgi:cell division protein FtsI (penicillin-binding protein 3)